MDVVVVRVAVFHFNGISSLGEFNSESMNRSCEMSEEASRSFIWDEAIQLLFAEIHSLNLFFKRPSPFYCVYFAPEISSILSVLSR